MRWHKRDESKPYLWHGWFAWHPVVVDGENVWLERILRIRRSSFAGAWYEYRHIGRDYS